MNFKIYYIGILLLLIGTDVFAQVVEIKGRVLRSVDRKPVAQAQVSAGASEKSVITDEKGEFTLEVTNRNTQIKVERDGYVDKTVFLGKRDKIDIYLLPVNLVRHATNTDLPAGRIASEEKTGSTVTINKKDLNLANDVPDESLHGMIAGLQVKSKGGMPGEGAFVNMRGIRSLYTSSTPLIVVDGMPYLPDVTESQVINGYSRNMFMPVHLKDVENISLVKGNDAAMYGSLGANGVILINTEKATDLETKVEFHTVEGAGWVNKRIPMMDAVGFKNYIGDIGETATSDLESLVNKFPFLKDDPDYHYNYVYNNNTRWQDEIYTPAITSENVLKVKGGDAIANYALSVGYFYNRGVIENTKLSKYFTRLNANMKITPKLNMFASVGFTYSDNKLMEQGMAYSTNPLLTALYKSPLFDVYEKDQYGNQLGRFSKIEYGENNPVADAIGISNPVAIVNDLEATSSAYDVLVNAGLNYQMNSKIAFNALVGVYYNYNRENIFIPGKTSQAIAPLLDGIAKNTVRSGIAEGYNLYFNANGTYSDVFNDVHGLDVALGYQLITTNREYDYGTGINTSSDFYKTLGSATGMYGKNFDGYIDVYNWMNIYAKAAYNFKKQLFLSAGVTADAASSTGTKSNLFVFLPSANIAWNMKNSSFLRDASGVDQLTVRAEYAQLANSRFSSSFSRYQYKSKLYRDQTGIVRSNIPNSRLKPEINHNYNVGVDFATLGRKLSVSVDVFQERTKNMLNQKELASAYGFGYVYDNAGEIKSRGIEVAAQAQLVNRGGFEWVVGGNIAAFKSEVVSLGGVDEKVIEFADGTTLVNRVGETPYAFYGVKAEKVFASQAEADEAAILSHNGVRFNAGDVKFQDVNTDHMIDDKDRRILGSATPDFYGGFYTSFRYKGIGLMANFTYSYGNKIYNTVRRTTESLSDYRNQSEVAVRRWTFDGQQTDVPRAAYGDPMGNARFSDRWVEDGSYLRLKYITLSYDFPGSVGFFKQAQIYVTGENLFTATKYLGLDPEFSYTYEPALQGIDMGKAPLARSVRLGVKLNF